MEHLHPAGDAHPNFHLGTGLGLADFVGLHVMDSCLVCTDLSGTPQFADRARIFLCSVVRCRYIEAVA
jgi:hypothetical protein